MQNKRLAINMIASLFSFVISMGISFVLSPYIINTVGSEAYGFVNLANNFVSSVKEEQTIAKFIEHLKHAIKFMGIDNICVGFDFMDYLSDFPNSNLAEVNNASLVHYLVTAMENAGFTSEEINKICYSNFYNRYKDKISMRG